MLKGNASGLTRVQCDEEPAPAYTATQTASPSRCRLGVASRAPIARYAGFSFPPPFHFHSLQKIPGIALLYVVAWLFALHKGVRAALLRFLIIGNGLFYLLRVIERPTAKHTNLAFCQVFLFNG